MAKIYLGTDHRGFELKEKIAQWLFENGYPSVDDRGAHFLDPGDDYTKYSQEVASLVAADGKARGILFCGSGVGVDITANKFDGVRASIGISPEQVVSARQHDDMNILVIAADHIDHNLAQEMVKVFLETDFDKLERHQKRLDEIKRIEANN